MDKLDTIFLNFLRSRIAIPNGVEIKIEKDPPYYTNVIFMADASKMDMNGPNYNEEYSKFFIRKKRKPTQGIVIPLAWENRIIPTVEDFYKITDIPYSERNYKIHNLIFNYDYLEKIENKIEEAIKKTDFPNITLEFTKDSDPDIKLLFRGFTKEQFGDKDMYKEFMRQLSEILGSDVNMDSYQIAYTMSKGK